MPFIFPENPEHPVKEMAARQIKRHRGRP